MTTVILLDLNLLLLKSSTVFGIKKIFAKIEIYTQNCSFFIVNKIIKQPVNAEGRRNPETMKIGIFIVNKRLSN